MTRRRIDLNEMATRLIAAKRMVAGMKDAMPSMAAELRREACETLDEVIARLTAAGS